MAAVRSGKEPADFIPKTVESKVELSVRWVNVEKPMSIPEFQSECKTKHHPRDLGVAVCSRPGRRRTAPGSQAYLAVLAHAEEFVARTVHDATEAAADKPEEEEDKPE